MASENSSNYFKCEKCHEYCRHVKVSWAEYFQYHGNPSRSGLWSILGFVQDINPRSLFDKAWKCSKCGRVDGRNLSVKVM